MVTSIASYSVDEIVAWLEENEIANNVVDKVREEEIDGQLMLEIEEQDLATTLASRLKDRIAVKKLLRAQKVSTMYLRRRAVMRHCLP